MHDYPPLNFRHDTTKSETSSHLEERLDLGPGLQLLLGHPLGDPARVPVDARHQGVPERLVGRALVGGLDDHGLATGEAAGQQQHHLAALHNLAHGEGRREHGLERRLLGPEVEGKRKRENQLKIVDDSRLKRQQTAVNKSADSFQARQPAARKISRLKI